MEFVFSNYSLDKSNTLELDETFAVVLPFSPYVIFLKFSMLSSSRWITFIINIQ